MTEIIADPHFATLGKPSSPWAITTHAGAVMTPSVENNILRLDISKTSGANWHAELRYGPFPVEVGETFTVSFAAKSSQFFSFSVWLGQMEEPYSSLVPDSNHFGEEMMIDTWQTFTHTWKPDLAEKNARLNFVLGQIDTVVELKDISLKKA